LYVGGNSGATNPCENMCSKKGHLMDGMHTKRLFQPALPPDPNAHLARIPLQGGRMVGHDDQNLIESGTVVEFAYQHPKDVDNHYQWVPKRTRFDKTFALQKSTTSKKQIFKMLEYTFKSGNAEFVTKQGSVWNKLRLNKSQRVQFDFRQRIIKGSQRLTINTFLQLVETYAKSSHPNKKVLLDFLRSNFGRVITSPDVLPVNTNYGNHQTTANSVWRTIHYPITVPMITSGNGIPLVEAEEEVYYDTPAGQRRSNSSTIGLQRYHNFIKRNGLLVPASKGFPSKTHSTILDLACGKGGDLPKWKDVNAECVVGTDIARDNLENPNDGACVRYNEMCNLAKSRKETVPKVFFFQADSGENVVDQIKNRNDKSSDLFRNLWYDLKGDKTGFFPAFSYPENRFSIVSLQFALHYFWESSSSLTNLIENVSSNIRTDGVFVGCCFNGNRVMGLLKDQDSVEASKGNRLLWKITKRYTETEMPVGDKSIGLPIEVFMSSINKTHREYLVNFGYLKNILERVPHQMTPLSREEANELGLPDCYNPQTGTASFSDISSELTHMRTGGSSNWSITAKERDAALRSISTMSPAERKLSFLNDMFVFRKRA
jgi:SAM-dependent methyltransferase